MICNVPSLTPRHPTEGRKRDREPVVHLGRGDRIVCAWGLDGDYGTNDPEKVTCAYCLRLVQMKDGLK